MANPAGSFIWYELMTPDPAGSKRFYDAVVAGWTIEAQPSGEMDYRMIVRSDGGHSGGVLRLTEEMQRHGARPCWLGYLGVPDVDAAVARVEEDGGRTLMPGHDIPGVGRIAMVADPDGAPFYLMTPTAPAGRPDAESDVFSVDRPQHVRWNELQASDQDRSPWRCARCRECRGPASASAHRPPRPGRPPHPHRGRRGSRASTAARRAPASPRSAATLRRCSRHRFGQSSGSPSRRTAAPQWSSPRRPRRRSAWTRPGQGSSAHTR